jgi:hypothetical protein
LSREKCVKNAFKIFTTRHSTCPQNSTCPFYLSTKFYLSILLVHKILLVHSTCPQKSTCPFYLSLFVCLTAKKIDTELVSFSGEVQKFTYRASQPNFFGSSRNFARNVARRISHFPGRCRYICTQYVQYVLYVLLVR